MLVVDAIKFDSFIGENMKDHFNFIYYSKEVKLLIYFTYWFTFILMISFRNLKSFHFPLKLWNILKNELYSRN